MTIDTNCSHGIPLVGHECAQCEAAWNVQVTIPQVRALIHRLMRFYDVETLRELVFAQNHHVEKLQAKLPPMRGHERTQVRG